MSHKIRRFGLITLIAAVAVGVTVAMVAAQVAGLVANVPEPAGATYQAKDAIHEGGVHFYYTTSQAPADVVSAYGAALETLGWEITDSGGGGDPFGLFGSGAGRLLKTLDSFYSSADRAL